MLEDHETKDLLNSKFNLLILDGAFPECALGLQYKFNVPFMYINTVGFYTGSISRSGSPAPYAITPHFSVALTDDMNFIQRVTNMAIHIGLQMFHSVSFTKLFDIVESLSTCKPELRCLSQSFPINLNTILWKMNKTSI
jgi:hypothetical protein